MEKIILCDILHDRFTLESFKIIFMVSAYYITLSEKAKYKIELNMFSSMKKCGKEKSLSNYVVDRQLQKMVEGHKNLRNAHNCSKNI